MRLRKLVKFVLAMAGSGGFAVLLSGSAFAADSSVHMPTVIGLKTGSMALETTNTLAASTSVSMISTASLGASVILGASSGSLPPVDGGGTAVGPSAAGTTSTAKDPQKSDTKSQPAAGNTVAEDVQSLDVPVRAVSSLNAPSAPSTDGDFALNAGSSLARRVGIAEHQISAASAISAIAFHSTLLAVQPKVTSSRSAAVDDLAALIPSAPLQQQSPAEVPAPMQPTGLLTRLTFELAGVVVPQLLLLSDWGAIDASVNLVIFLTSLMLICGFVKLSFGAWLRRSGYMHAARSDVADFLLFATPFGLGYVPASGHHIAHFLMASDMKIVSLSVFRKEELRW